MADEIYHLYDQGTCDLLALMAESRVAALLDEYLHESLKPKIIARILDSPDADARDYLAHLSAAFHEAHDIPHQLVGVPSSGEGGVTEAVELLLSLPLGRFTRQELLRLAVHPAVVASLDDVDPGRWLEW